VHKGGAVFDLEKLDWVNWQWQRRLFNAAPGEKSEKLLALVREHIPQEWLKDEEFLKRCLLSIEEKTIKNPTNAASFLMFYFKDTVHIDPGLMLNPKMKVDAPTARKALTAVKDALVGFNNFDDQEALKTRLTELISTLGLKNGQVLWPARVALTGEAFSPGVFEVLWALGKEKSLARLTAALATKFI